MSFKLKRNLKSICWLDGAFGSCLLAAFAVALLLPSQGYAQLAIQAAEVQIGTRADEKAQKDNEEKYAGGAGLKTDSDLEDQLKRASAFVAEKNYRNATIIWDRVLEKSENSLITRDGETYVSLVREVEQTIRNLPEAGLQVYRISADGKARALMPGDPSQASEDDLTKLVRLYFMSSIGDDAAFELGSRALDKRDFVSASRMFGKILEEHPDPSIDRSLVVLRSAIASANLGDRDAAVKLVESIQANDSTTKLKENVVQHIDFVAKAKGTDFTAGGESIRMRLGSVDRSGVMPDLPPNAVSGDLTQGYEFRFPYQYSHGTPDAELGKVIKGGKVGGEADPAAAALSKKWQTEKWVPASQLLFAGNRIVVKTTNDLVCIDATAKSDLAVWHSLWLNHFELDDASRNAKAFSTTNRSSNVSRVPLTLPASALESLYFFDKIHHSMTLHNGTVFSIEGKNYSQLDESPPVIKKTNAVRTGFGQPANLTRARTNYLTAYNLRTGKVLWTRSAYDPEMREGADEEETAEDGGRVGFIGTPVPFGNLLLCPVTEGGAIYIYSIDSTNGKSIWKTFLCDDPAEGVSLFSPVEVTIEGQEAYVTCGSGVLFALNAATGNIQFARRYKRDGTKKKYQVNYNQYQNVHISDGWDEDVVVTWRNALVVMASDHDYVFAVDRRNGKFLWDAPRIPFDQDVDHAYCLGHFNDKLYMATNKSVLCYSLAGDGKLQWYQKLTGNSYGRGFITSKGVYIPVENSIAKFDIQTGKKLSQVGVNLGTENKVGNLFSDGSQIWVVGMNRVVRLRSLRDRLTELNQKIEQNDIDALRERLGIYTRLKEYGNAIADSGRLFELEEKDKPKVLKEILTRFKDSGMTSAAAAELLPFMSDLLKMVHADKALSQVATENYSVFFETAENLIMNEPATNQQVLGWIEHAPSGSFLRSIGGFLERYPPSFDSLKPVLGNASEEVVLALIPVAAKVPEKSQLLQSLFASESEAIQLAAAREVAILADKSCMEPALRLLESADPQRRVQAFLILKNVTGQAIEFDTNADEAARKEVVAKWKKWIEENGENLKIEKPVSLKYGRILVATASEILEYSITADKFVKAYESDKFRPEDVSTTDIGRRIVCEYVRKQIVEMDLSGNPTVKISTEFSPRSVRKLSNGNYLVAWRSNTKPVVELDGKGKVVWSPKGLVGDARSAERLANGNTLVTLSNRVVELDENGNVVYQIGQAQQVNNCAESRRLPNGNTLIVYGTTVAEFDKDKNRVMRIQGSISPKSVVRLADGRTLVAHSNGLRVFDKDGKRVDELVNRLVNAVWHY